MELTHLPLELVYSSLLPFLRFNDLLRLRQVNKDLQRLVKTFIIHELDGIPSRITIQINSQHTNTWNDISPFLEFSVSAKSFYLNNTSGPEFFGNCEVLPKFMKMYGKEIKHLRVHKYSVFPSAHEKAFYQSLRRLESLQIDSVVQNENESTKQKKSIWKKLAFRCSKKKYTAHLSLPDCFKSIKLLKISHNPNSEVPAESLWLLNTSFLQKCQNLEEVKLAISRGTGSYSVLLTRYFREIYRYIKKRAANLLPNQSNLKIVDFGNCSPITADVVRKISPIFLELCRLFATHSVKVRNVPASLFKAFHPLAHEPQILSSVIDSMDGLHPVVLQTDLMNLTSLSVITVLQPSFLGGPLPHRAHWPQLRQLKLLVNTRNLWGCTRQGRKIPSLPVAALYELLFGSRSQRDSLEHLRIQFSSRILDSLSSDLKTMPCPRVHNIVSSCPNVTKLEIVNWPSGDNLAFSEFWSHLELLEDVRLSKCKLLGDRGFIGRNEKEPAFLNLKKLKRVWLIDLDKMPLITDKVFRLVFCHLKVSEFILYSEKPLKSVTQDGVMSLLSGEFADSVENFPFGNYWSLNDMDKAQWSRLHRRFSSGLNFKDDC